ncbi:putative cyclase [Gymnopus androsaceus JB14]|uniref:Cyclase n=1 Tax=Gymnopus androsaceus JB14 TaxID=1447944 RepID=A0A6A4H432_9AGAR|nr:putative cyclase [Gymnopus androsaceus JB14]
MIIDLTHPLDPNKLTIYPGDPGLKCYGYSVHALSLGSHTGTHIDAPSHFILNGKTIDEIPLDTLVSRPALVVDLTHKKARSKILWDEDLAEFAPKMKDLGPGMILLLRTGWSERWATPTYMEKYPYLDRHAAEQILSMGVKIVGLDTISPDEIDGPEGYGAHEAILGTGGLIVENLTNLKALAEIGREVMVSIVPLSLTGCDGSPVRAFGWKAQVQ